MSKTRLTWSRRLLAALCVFAALPVAVALADDPGTRPPGCSSHFLTPNPRARVVTTNAVLHEMSNPPVCSPHGPLLGNLKAGSHFNVYYADPGDASWCYGYSVQLARKGYVLCADVPS